MFLKDNFLAAIIYNYSYSCNMLSYAVVNTGLKEPKGFYKADFSCGTLRTMRSNLKYEMGHSGVSWG